MADEATRRGARVITVSVSDTRRAATDVSGRVLDGALRAAGFAPLRHVLLRDEPDEIRALLEAVAAGDEADAVVLTGGTGIGPRDQTYEAVESLLTKRLDGFGEAFRRLSWEDIGARAVLSRATAGVVGRLLVVSLPGSTRAVTLAVRSLLAHVLDHAVDVARGRHGNHDP